MFENNKVQVRKERPARREPLDEKEVKALLREMSRVFIAKGKKVNAHLAKDVKPAMLKGPSGNFRAPMLIRGKSMLVGYSADTLDSWFG